MTRLGRAITIPTQIFPQSFNAIVFGDLSGIPNSEGALAAGGNVTLSNFAAINALKQGTDAIVVGQALHAKSGMVFGNVHYGTTLHLVPSVDVQGVATHGTPVDFARARSRLLNLSSMLSNHPPTSTTQVDAWGGVVLEGADPKQNVFTLTATALAAANAIQVNVPKGAVALINVSGTAARVANCGITLIHTDREHLIWNFYAARSVTFASVNMLGSVLAPSAAVALTNGSLAGTIVAQTLSGTNASLLSAPYVGFDVGSNLNRLVVDMPNRLLAGCS